MYVPLLRRVDALREEAYTDDPPHHPGAVRDRSCFPSLAVLGYSDDERISERCRDPGATVLVVIHSPDQGDEGEEGKTSSGTIIAPHSVQLREPLSVSPAFPLQIRRSNRYAR